MAVCATDLAGLMTQLACGYTFDQALATGFEVGAKAWRQPKTLAPLAVHKKVKARLKKVEAMDKAGAKLEPKDTRAAALSLTSALRKAVVG